MKAHHNYLFVESGDPQISDLERIAESYCERGYVYLARKGLTEMQDTPSGVRLLPYRELRKLPHIGDLKAVFVAGDRNNCDEIRRRYPGVEVHQWTDVRDSKVRELPHPARPELATLSPAPGSC